MKYKDFVDQISRLTECQPDQIREVLDALPKVLLRLKENEGVRTPIGILKLKRRKEKRVLIPNTNQWAYASEQLRIKLQPHKDLCIEAAHLTEADRKFRLGRSGS